MIKKGSLSKCSFNFGYLKENKTFSNHPTVQIIKINNRIES